MPYPIPSAARRGMTASRAAKHRVYWCKTCSAPGGTLGLRLPSPMHASGETSADGWISDGVKEIVDGEDIGAADLAYGRRNGSELAGEQPGRRLAVSLCVNQSESSGFGQRFREGKVKTWHGARPFDPAARKGSRLWP